VLSSVLGVDVGCLSSPDAVAISIAGTAGSVLVKASSYILAAH
jgi:hypothetical protein